MSVATGSSISWLDQSDDERRKVLDVIDLFGERDTRDELGLGSIRDGFADAMFPGTSTIQTRVRYFLLVPWVYERVEERFTGQHNVAQRARDLEVRLIAGLRRSDDLVGVIGRDAGASLKRLPSEVYWQGLRAWGIRRFPGSREQYHRAIENGQLAHAPGLPAPEDGDDLLVDTSGAAWHPNLPGPPFGFPNEASLALTLSDAEYLTERILATVPKTLLAWLVRHGTTEDLDAPFAWAHLRAPRLPSRLADPLEHARSFSEAMHGAQLLYNVLLAEAGGRADLVDEYRAWLATWAEGLDVATWSREDFWDVVSTTPARVDPATRAFVDQWLERGIDAGADGVADRPPARQLVREREIGVKRGQARLANSRALAMWGGASATAQLDFRWLVTRTHVRDILAGRQSAGA